MNTLSREWKVVINCLQSLTDYSLSETPLTVIKPKSTSNASTPQEQNKTNTTSICTPSSISSVPQTPADLSEFPSVSLVDSEAVEFEDESSLHAHSIAARDLLVQMLGNHSHVRANPKMIAALSSLRQIVEADKVTPSQRKPKLTGLGGSRQLIYELKLPPTDVVLDILRKSKGKSSNFFLALFPEISA
jgi:hypothetical protein